MKHLQQYSMKAVARSSESNKHGSIVLRIFSKESFDLRFDEQSFLNLTTANLTKRTITAGFYANSYFWKCRNRSTCYIL